MFRQKITKARVDTLVTPPTGQLFLRDTELRGFAVRVAASGAKSFVIERWRREYNEIRPHSSLGYRPPAPAACSPRPLMLAHPQMVQ